MQEKVEAPLDELLVARNHQFCTSGLKRSTLKLSKGAQPISFSKGLRSESESFLGMASFSSTNSKSRSTLNCETSHFRIEYRNPEIEGWTPVC